jgi:hypothetical protein
MFAHQPIRATNYLPQDVHRYQNTRKSLESGGVIEVIEGTTLSTIRNATACNEHGTC